jgi:hypothetical protein
MKSFTIAVILFLVYACSSVQCSPGKSSHPQSPEKIAWDPFLDTLQQRTLQFFLDAAEPSNGLLPDRWPASGSPSSIASVGFGLTAYPIAVERGLIKREEAGKRVLKTLRYLFDLPQDQHANRGGYKGFFYHFITMKDATRMWNSELSTIDTGLLMAGALCCMSYFDGKDSLETDIRSIADTLYRRVDWKWAMAGKNGIALGWTPENGFDPGQWRGYDEAMILHILALGSPTHPVPESVWDVWTTTYLWAKFRGEGFVSFAPLFGHQFSHCWIDYRGIKDLYMVAKGIDYFENSRRATITQHSYAEENPNHWRDYSDSIWGLTACDGPGNSPLTIDGIKRTFEGYAARGVSIDWSNDDGTIAPTAAASSIVFTPELSIPAVKAIRAKYDTLVFRKYGFIDAFNRTHVTKSAPQGWFDSDYLGIDQGPIAIMIENLRSEFVWNLMKKNPYIVRGLQRAGFKGGWLDTVKTGGK